MKSKMTVPTLNPRNPFVTLAHKRKAGSHIKPYKSLRKAEKQRDRSSGAEQGAFNAKVEISKFSGHTILKYTNRCWFSHIVLSKPVSRRY